MSSNGTPLEFALPRCKGFEVLLNKGFYYTRIKVNRNKNFVEFFTEAVFVGMYFKGEGSSVEVTLDQFFKQG
mgnify:CR=1 FL=1